MKSLYYIITGLICFTFSTNAQQSCSTPTEFMWPTWFYSDGSPYNFASNGTPELTLLVESITGSCENGATTFFSKDAASSGTGEDYLTTGMVCNATTNNVPGLLIQYTLDPTMQDICFPIYDIDAKFETGTMVRQDQVSVRAFANGVEVIGTYTLDPSSTIVQVNSNTFKGTQLHSYNTGGAPIVPPDPLAILESCFSGAVDSIVVILSSGPDATYPTDPSVNVDHDIYHGSLSWCELGNPPVANADDYTLNLNDPATTLNVIANDTDPDNDIVASSVNNTCPVCTTTANGTLVNNGDGTFSYQPNLDFYGDDSFIYQVCDATGACDTALVTIQINLNRVLLLPKVLLAGALLSTSDGLMRDDLRIGNYIPLNEPYSAMSQFTHVGSGGAETISNADILTVSGANAIVDWVFVALRSATDFSIVVETRSGLVQRDGDIVEVDGVSPLIFWQSMPGQYYVSVRHRNHLGVMTANTQTLTQSGSLVDFTDASLDNYISSGTFAGLSQKTQSNGNKSLWLGNANSDNKVKYQGVSNDPNKISTDVLFHPNNGAFGYNFDAGFSYYNGDVNMDGKVKYQGASNDANFVSNEVLFYPLNSGFSYNYDFFLEQLP